MKEALLFLSWTSLDKWIGPLITAAVTILSGSFLWWRFAPKDKADVRKLDAEVKKIIADTEKTTIESELTVAAAWRAMVEELKADSKAKAIEMHNIEMQLNETRKLNEEMRGLLRLSDQRLSEAEKELTASRERIRLQDIEIEKLNQQIQKSKDGTNS